MQSARHCCGSPQCNLTNGYRIVGPCIRVQETRAAAPFCRCRAQHADNNVHNDTSVAQAAPTSTTQEKQTGLDTRMATTKSRPQAATHTVATAAHTHAPPPPHQHDHLLSRQRSLLARSGLQSIRRVAGKQRNQRLDLLLHRRRLQPAHTTPHSSAIET